MIGAPVGGKRLKSREDGSEIFLKSGIHDYDHERLLLSERLRI